MAENIEKTIIIGAGPAGLACALEILKKNPKAQVSVYEATNEIGGISKTAEIDGYRMDMGGHRFFSKEKEIVDWWADILPTQGAPAKDDKALNRQCTLSESGPDPEAEDDVMLVRHRISRIFYDGTFFDYPISMSLKTMKDMGLRRMSACACSYFKSMIAKKPESNLENFYINRFGKKLYSMFFEDYTTKLWGRHPSEIAADWGAQRVKGLSVIAVLKNMLHLDGKDKETSLIEEFLYPKYGPGHLYEKVAQRVEALGGHVVFESQVSGLRHREHGKWLISIEHSDGSMSEIVADNVVSTMPVKDLIMAMNNMDSESVPADMLRIAQGLPYRDFVTVGVLIDEKSMQVRNTTDYKTIDGIVPDNWIYIQTPGVNMGRLQIFNNWSPYLIEDDGKVWVGCEFFCNEGDEFWNMPEHECCALAIRELQQIGIITEDGAQRIAMTHREQVRKAYPAYFDTYAEIGALREWLQSQQGLYCAGRNGQHRYNNMDHSIMTGILAARAICGEAVSQQDIWNVNTEEEYHESN